MKIIIILLCILTLIQAEGGSMKAKINFHKDGKLMWLIDTTDRNKRYSMKTKYEYEVEGYTTEESYENYLNYVNTHKKYKYNNWRLPTKEELFTLELKDTFFVRLFASSEQKKTQVCIDTEIFYDHKLRHAGDYWTSEVCTTGRGKDGYISIDFNALRFNPNSYLKASPAWGIVYGCTVRYGMSDVRFVRDVK